MSEFEKVKLLHQALDERGRKEEARNVLRAIRKLLTIHFPEPLHRAFDRYETAYGDLAALARAVPGAARLDGERVSGGGTGDPTGRQALHLARIERVDEDLRALYEEHLPALSQPARRRVRVWREDAADAYTSRTVLEIREEYSA